MRIIKLSFIIVLMSFLLLFTSCTTETNEESVTLTLWHYYTSTQAQAFSKKIEEFNSTIGKEENIYIKETSQVSVGQLESNLLDSANHEVGAQTFPDMFMSYADTAYALNKLGMMTDLNPYFTKEELDKYNEDFLKEGTFADGSLKILPIAKSTEALYINKTGFDAFASAKPELNITLDKLKTIEGLIEVSQAYYEWCGKAFYGRDALSNYFLVGSKQLGTDLFSYDSNGNFKVNFDKDIFRAIYDTYYLPYIQGYFTASGRFRSADLKSGKILCYTGSTSSSIFFPTEVIISDTETQAIECYVVETPIFAGATNKVAISQGAGLAVTKSTERKERAAVRFAKWFTQEDVNQDFAAETSYMPVNKNALTEEFLSSTTGINRQSYAVCKTIEEEYEMYASVASEYSSNIRSLLENSLSNYASEAYAAIDNLIAQGSSLEDATSQYASDAYFNAWYEDLKALIEEYVNEG